MIAPGLDVLPPNSHLCPNFGRMDPYSLSDDDDDEAARLHADVQATGATARTRGPQPPAPMKAIRMRRSHRLYGLAMRDLIKELADLLIVDPASAAIVQLIHIRAAPVAGLLAWTHCRWSELPSIDQRRVLNGHSFGISASKGSRGRVITAMPGGCVPLFDAVPRDIPLILDPYDRINRWLRQAAKAAGVALPESARDGTHQFRHLYASWVKHAGWADDRIQEALGHVHPGSKAGYLHDWYSIFKPPTNE